MKDKRTFFFFSYSLSLLLSSRREEIRFSPFPREYPEISRYQNRGIGEGAVFFTLERAEIRVFVRERGRWSGNVSFQSEHGSSGMGSAKFSRSSRYSRDSRAAARIELRSDPIWRGRACRNEGIVVLEWKIANRRKKGIGSDFQPRYFYVA